MTLYKDKYRVATTRLKHWDYAAAGCYFVTICTAHRQPFLGEITNQTMRLSDVGTVANEEWLKSAQIRSNIKLDAFTIMLNHIHGIVIILNQLGGDAQRRVSTGPNKFGPLAHGALQTVINGFKGAVTRWCKANQHHTFAWQPRFWEHIIRDEPELQRIRAYIDNNVLKWALDRENTPSLWM